MVTTSGEYRANNVSVIVEWTEEEGVSYNITINPSVPKTFTRSASVQLISYNTEYNVSLEAVAVCQSVAPSHCIQLFHGEFSNFSILVYVHTHNIRVHLFNYYYS